MKRNGFTLIELLAVIVILAIIALIAVPIILNIVDDAEEKSAERSIELYASAVKNAIASYRLNNTVAPEKFSDLTVEYDGDVECKTQILYPDKTIYLAGCTVNDGEKEYSYGRKPVCTIEKQNESKYSVGDVVTCELSESTDKFYIIEEAELTATSIQMLTEKNIHKTEFRQSDDAGTIRFSTSKYWSNETTYPVNVYDERNDKVKPIVDEYVSYLNTKLTGATGNLLTYSQAENLNCSGKDFSCKSASEWVYSTWYWTGSADDSRVWRVFSGGPFGHGDFSIDYAYAGVRPVITISTNDIK